MNIELRKFHSSERLSQETLAFAADLYINGQRVGYAENDGHGGSTSYHAYDLSLSPLLKEAEAYALTLPAKVYSYDDGTSLTSPMDLETLIDDLCLEELKKKDDKKIVKKFVNCVIWGVPNSGEYKVMKFKCPLSAVPLAKLQGYCDKWKGEFKTGEAFINTNLESLGIKI